MHLRPLCLGLQLDVWWQLEPFDVVHVTLPIVIELPEDVRLDNRVVLGQHAEELESCVCFTSNVVLLEQGSEDFYGWWVG